MRHSWPIVVYAASFMILPVSDALAKHLASRYPVAEIGAIRFGVHFLIVCAAVLFWYGKRALRTRRPLAHLLRGLLMATSTLCIFGALRTTAIANVAIILFVTPLFVVALSGRILGDRVRIGQWIAVGAGLVGVTMVLRPTPHGMSWGLLLALAAALCGALYQLVSRRLAATEKPLVGLFYLTLVGTVTLGALAVPTWLTPAPEDGMFMIVMGVIASVAFFGIFKSIEAASPARLAPFFYLQIITATALGYWVFGDIPDGWVIGGMAVIVAAGLVCLRIERRQGATRVKNLELQE